MILVWSARALEGRHAQLDYIAADNFAAANEVDREIERQTKRLIEHPELGRPGRVAGTRELVIQRTSLIVVYRIRPRGRRIELLRVLHGAQRWP